MGRGRGLCLSRSKRPLGWPFLKPKCHPALSATSSLPLFHLAIPQYTGSSSSWTRDGPSHSCMEALGLLTTGPLREVPLPSFPPVALVHQNSSEALQESFGTPSRGCLCPLPQPPALPATCPQPPGGPCPVGGAYWSWVSASLFPFFHTGTVGMSEQTLFLCVFSGESGYIGWGWEGMSACCVCVWTLARVTGLEAVCRHVLPVLVLEVWCVSMPPEMEVRGGSRGDICI